MFYHSVDDRNTGNSIGMCEFRTLAFILQHRENVMLLSNIEKRKLLTRK